MLIDKAWDIGFDPQGSASFQPEGLRNSNRWIGATEVWTCLQSIGCRSKLIDFSSNDFRSAGKAVVEWLLAYFYSDQEEASFNRSASAVPFKDCSIRGGFGFTSNPWVESPAWRRTVPSVGVCMAL